MLRLKHHMRLEVSEAFVAEIVEVGRRQGLTAAIELNWSISYPLIFHYRNRECICSAENWVLLGYKKPAVPRNAELQHKLSHDIFGL